MRLPSVGGLLATHLRRHAIKLPEQIRTDDQFTRRWCELQCGEWNDRTDHATKPPPVITGQTRLHDDGAATGATQLNATASVLETLPIHRLVEWS